MLVIAAPTELSVSELLREFSEVPDVIILGEGCESREWDGVERKWPSAVVVGATKAGLCSAAPRPGHSQRPFMRGFIRRNGKELEWYEKWGSDGITSCGALGCRPVKEQGIPAVVPVERMHVGILVCMDVFGPMNNNEDGLAELRQKVIGDLNGKDTGILAVPAFMGKYLEDDPLGSVFHGCNVVLSNRRQDQGAVRTFMADKTGRKQPPKMRSQTGLTAWSIPNGEVL